MANVKYTNRKKNQLKSLLALVVAIFMIFTLTMVLTPAVAAPNDNASDKAKSNAPVTNSENHVYLIKNHNAKVKDQFEVRHNFDVGFTARLNEHQLAGLEKAGIIVEPVALYQLVAPPKKCDPWPACKNGGDDGGDSGATRQYVPSTQYPYGITMVKGGSGGADVNVAVLDSGVFKDHLDLDVKLCKDTTKRGVRNGCADKNGHGTHVSGTVAANGGEDEKGIFGVAPDANLWMIKVCNSSCWTDDMATGIRYAADQGAHIISMSIGGNSQSTLVKNAVDYAITNGVLVIAAAGNDGPNNGSIDYPGAYVKIIAVGAIDSKKDVPNWSSRGIIGSQENVIEEREVEFGAPGVSVLSTWKNGGYGTLSGTSMATPHIAGLAAKLWTGDPVETRNLLQNLAKDHDLHIEVGYDTATGFGLPISP
jgi:subtilisin